MALRRQRLPEVGEGDEYEMRAPDDLLYNVEDSKEHRIVLWRLDCFERLGFSPTAAAALAVRRDIDRQKVQDMLLAGARPLQVAAILL